MVFPLNITSNPGPSASDGSTPPTTSTPSTTIQQSSSPTSTSNVGSPMPSAPVKSYVQAARQGIVRNGRRHHSVTPLNACASSDVCQQLHAVSQDGVISDPSLLRRGTEEYSVFFDLTTHSINENDFFKAACVLLPDWDVGIGMMPHRDKGNLLYELTLPDEDTCTYVMSKGVTVGGVHLPAIRSLHPTRKLTKLELEKLPTCLLIRQLEEGLRATLSKFGSVVQLGLYRAAEGWFQGYGYAVLLNNEEDESINNLSHRISYGQINGREHEFYAVWKEMGTYCRYCHASDHVIAKCPTRPSQGCFNCNRLGHIAANCPRLPNEMPHKHARKSESSIGNSNGIAKANKTKRSKVSKITPTPKELVATSPSTIASDSTTPSESEPSVSTSPKNFIRIPSMLLRSSTSSDVLAADAQEIFSTPASLEVTSKAAFSISHANPEAATPAQADHDSESDPMSEDELQELHVDMLRHGDRIIENSGDSSVRITRSMVSGGPSGAQASIYNPQNQVSDTVTMESLSNPQDGSGDDPLGSRHVDQCS